MLKLVLDKKGKVWYNMFKYTYKCPYCKVVQDVSKKQEFKHAVNCTDKDIEKLERVWKAPTLIIKN